MLSWRSSLRLIVVLFVFVLAALPVQGMARADDSGAPMPILARALADMNVRSGPGLEFPRIGVLLTGQQVSLDGRSGEWFRFGEPGSPVKGWINRHLVKVTGDPTLLPDVTFDTNLVILTPPSDSPGVPEGIDTCVDIVDSVARPWYALSAGPKASVD